MMSEMIYDHLSDIVYFLDVGHRGIYFVFIIDCFTNCFFIINSIIIYAVLLQSVKAFFNPSMKTRKVTSFHINYIKRLVLFKFH